MAFSFGATPAAAAAPAAGGFSFGGAPAAAATPAPAGGGLFGAATLAPAAAVTPTAAGGGSFSFGGAPAPAAGGLFGGTPAAAPAAGGMFGATPAAAPVAGGLFGATPAPAGGGLFGAPAPVPAAGGLFGAPAPAPAAGGLFGSPAPAAGGLFGGTPAPAPATGFGLGLGLGAAPAAQQQQQLAMSMSMQQHITANMPFHALPPNVQHMIDQIYNLHHQHNQTMSSVSTMTPSLLTDTNSDADKAAGINPAMGEISPSPLAEQIQKIHSKLNTHREELNHESSKVAEVYQTSQALYEMAHSCGIYPVQNIAARRGVELPPLIMGDGTGTAAGTTTHAGGAPGTPAAHSHPTSLQDTANKLNKMLHDNSSRVDRMEGMPSTYVWSTIQDLEKRMAGMSHRLHALKRELEKKVSMERERAQIYMNEGMGKGSGEEAELTTAIQNLMAHLTRVAGLVAQMDAQMNVLRMEYKRKLAEEKFRGGGRMGYGSHGSNAYGHKQGGQLAIYNNMNMTVDPFMEADQREDAEERRIEMEARNRVIQASASVPNPNPLTPAAPAAAAPLGGGLFGAPAPAAAPSGGGLFGATPVAAPVGGGLFGATPAPAAGGGFFGGAATPAAAPAAGGFSFGGTPAAAPAAGGLFGATPAAAPVTGGLFGAPAATPAVVAAPAGGLFGAPAATAAAAPAAGGFSFGGTPAAPAAAPVGGGLFGGAAATPAVAAPAPATSSRSRRRGGRKR